MYADTKQSIQEPSDSSAKSCKLSVSIDFMASLECSTYYKIPLTAILRSALYMILNSLHYNKEFSTNKAVGEGGGGGVDAGGGGGV